MRRTHDSMFVMPGLSFQKQYIDPILAGLKRVTVRRPHNHLPHAGDEITLHNGPRPAFARGRCVDVRPFTLDDCERLFALDGHDSPEAMRDAVAELYGDDAELVVVVFRVSRRQGRRVTA
jgi:hypothetical protein